MADEGEAIVPRPPPPLRTRSVQFIRSLVVRLGRSKWTAAVAALAAVAASASGFVSNAASQEAQSCDLQNKLELSAGSPALRAERAVEDKIYEAEVYLQLAQSAGDMDAKREYAYLSNLAINRAILMGPSEKNRKILWAFPNDKLIISPEFYSIRFDDIRKLEYSLLKASLVQHDSQFSETLSSVVICRRASFVADIWSFGSVIMTILSVFLIAIREHSHG